MNFPQKIPRFLTTTVPWTVSDAPSKPIKHPAEKKKPKIPTVALPFATTKRYAKRARASSAFNLALFYTYLRTYIFQLVSEFLIPNTS